MSTYMNYWLIKSEPTAFSIDDLEHCPHMTTCWDGVRNYQARNMLRDQMKKDDLAFFYHSNANPPGIVGIVKIVKKGYPDLSAFDSQEKHFDPDSDPNNPRWFMVDVRLVEKFQRLISLEQLKIHKDLASMPLLRKGNRLSVMPVTAKEWQIILTLR